MFHRLGTTISINPFNVSETFVMNFLQSAKGSRSFVPIYFQATTLFVFIFLMLPFVKFLRFGVWLLYLMNQYFLMDSFMLKNTLVHIMLWSLSTLIELWTSLSNTMCLRCNLLHYQHFHTDALTGPAFFFEVFLPKKLFL